MPTPCPNCGIFPNVGKLLLSLSHSLFFSNSSELRRGSRKVFGQTVGWKEDDIMIPTTYRRWLD
jgi:hypothetical protein